MFVVGHAGLEAEKILERCDSFWVEGMGRRAVYLKSDDDEVLVLSPNLLTPYTIEVSRGWSNLLSQLREKTRARPSKSCLTFDTGLSIALKNHKGPLPVGFGAPLNITNLKLAYNSYAILSTAAEVDSSIMDGIQALHVGDVGETLDLLIKILGRGPGFTPSGDDFVCGVVLGFRVLGIPLNVVKLVQHARELSRWPSWKMIEHSCHGCVFVPLISLCRALSGEGDVVEHLVDTVKVGASSGFAALSGFLETLNTFHRSLSNISFRSSSTSAGGDHSTSTTSTF
ncbi:MAG: DUF2877 domain-containing protein [Candidatus Caldarchaeum sp.]|nr:DUF2877 domain-containing protein [Candidatus Caldarchaeum sp.]